MVEKYLITGAAGFIGSEVTRNLTGQGKAVVGVVRQTTDRWRLPKSASLENLQLIKTDLADREQVQRLIQDCQPHHIIHLATYGVYPHQRDRREILLGNPTITFNLLSAVEKLRPPLKSFVNAGSVFEYGTQKGPVKENQVNPVDILGDYAASKIIQTTLAHSFADRLPVTTLRIFTAYGPYEARTRFVAATISRCLEGKPIRIAAGVIRDFVYISDVSQAIIQATSRINALKGRLINIGSGQPSSLEKVSAIIKDLTQSPSEVVIDKDYVRSQESRCWADTTVARETLDWQPTYPLEKGLAMTVNWFRAGEPSQIRPLA